MIDVSTSTLQENALKLLGDLDTYHKVYYPLLECFYCFNCRLPEAPFGKSVSNAATMVHVLNSLLVSCMSYILLLSSVIQPLMLTLRPPGCI